MNGRIRAKLRLAKAPNAPLSTAELRLAGVPRPGLEGYPESSDTKPSNPGRLEASLPADLAPSAALAVAETSNTELIIAQGPVSQVEAVQKKDLWEKAVHTLSDRDPEFDFGSADRLAVLNDVLTVVEAKKQRCMQRRWKYTKHNGDIIILRDVFEKIATWVEKFKAVGNAVVQYDPIHASLPWAGVRLLLQVSVNDSQTFGAMAEGVEFVSNLITQYVIIEHLYLRRPSVAKHQLEQALIALYAAVLEYLLKARRFYGRNTAKRMALSIVQTAETGVEKHLDKILDARTSVDFCVRLVEAEETCRKLKLILEELERPVIRMATQLSGLCDSLQELERERVFQWMSNVPYMNHHKAKVKDCLPGSGRWLFENEKFIEWRKSSASSIMWLHGIPGSGKSILVSSVVEHLYSESSVNKRPAPISYFYCARNAAEPERANPDEILRCILEQLSSSKADLPIREPVVEVYKEKKKEAKGRAPQKLILSETVDLILALLEDNPAIIVIDALDECDPAQRPNLLKALDLIIQESANLTKVFVSSRDDGDIVCRLAKWPNVFIDASDNRVDIEHFIRTEVAQAINEKRLIKGNVSKQLEHQIIGTLVNGAQGMFRWVSLQIQNLCDSRRIRYEEDIREELRRLPETLVESYDVIYQTISNSGRASRMVAEKAMKWLICAQRPLKCRELIAAVSVDSEGNCLRSSNDDLLDTCCNMVVLDSELDIFRFAHLSVREYLEGRGDYSLLEAHTLALERCLDVHTFQLEMAPSVEPTIEQNRILVPYANLYWPVHCQNAENDQLDENLTQKLRCFLFQGDCNPSSLFTKWVSAASESSGLLMWDDPLKDMLRAVSSSPPSLLFLACSFGLVSVINDLSSSENIDWNQRNDKENTGLHLAASSGHEVAVQLLLEKGAGIVARTARGETALHRAAEHGHKAVVRSLLEKGADVMAKDDRGRTALHGAAGSGHKEVVRLLLERGADVAAEDARGCVALHVAARRGHPEVARLLLEEGADVGTRDTGGWTALHTAAGRGHEAVVRQLLEKGAKVGAKDADGGTALHWASGCGHEAVVSLLFDKGADAGVQDADGGTALHAAAGRGHETVVRLLLENGADVTLKTTHGGTALHRAAERGRKAVEQILLEHCQEHNIAISDEDMSVTSKLANSSSYIYCDNCDGRIPSPDPHYHCNICDDDDFDLCQECIDKGTLCRGDGHRLIRRRIENGVCIDMTTEVIANSSMPQVSELPIR
ncbi:hypothetical protein FGG08_007034 [Glutinoglossum americanum]|uniref:Ankyrin repeat domain-containing protein 50 n=1 Tax=Glutinoglossum americanum TaxID=1670608 RepID=A0A9P8I660_9PEZI|nr:hypothetical protein FGG08_007034 [Glutinoglossum americanum]